MFNVKIRHCFVRQAIGSKALEIDKKIKDIFDPTGILNPGKLGLDIEERDKDVTYAFPEYVPDEELTK